ncbi:hypothetical protein ACL02S_12260 [Nocardia sp. 004]
MSVVDGRTLISGHLFGGQVFSSVRGAFQPIRKRGYSVEIRCEPLRIVVE